MVKFKQIMVQYIDKSVLVAEIYKLKKSHDNWSCLGKCFHQEYETLLSFIETLEVKEVDLEKLIDDYMLPITAQDVKEEPFTQLEKCAKHFFELGMTASNKEQKGE